MSDKSTPRPWVVGGAMISNGKETVALILRRPARFGGRTYETRDTDAGAPETGASSDANARLIVRAVNSFEAMREALRNLLPMWESGIREPWVEAARAALALADKTED